MTAATEAYMAVNLPDVLGTPSFFSAAISGEENNVFEKSFSGLAGMERAKNVGDLDQPSTKLASDSNQGPLPTATGDSFAAFLGYSSGLTPLPFGMLTQNGEGTVSKAAPASFRPNLDLSLSPAAVWDMSKDNAAYSAMPQQQEPSPPQSANSPPPFPFDELRRALKSPLHGFLVNEQSTDSRHGQITPPSEDNLMNIDPAIDPSLPMAVETAPADIKTENSPKAASNGNNKRKRGKGSSRDDGESTKTKRQRKSTISAASTEAMDFEETPQPGEGDQKRSRFLERNRLAASKCRQKKKEWTSNLETRARQLQNDKNQLALIVGFLKDEVLSLKGELLKHTDCNCDRIRQYLNQEVTNLAAQGPYGRSPNVTTTSPTMSSAHRSPSVDGTGSDSPSLGSESRRDSLATARTPSDTTSPNLAYKQLDFDSSVVAKAEDSYRGQFKSEDDQHLFDSLAAEIAP